MNNKFKQTSANMKTYRQMLVLTILLGVLKGEFTPPEPPTSFEPGNIQVLFDTHFIGEHDMFGFITPLAESDYLIGSTENQIIHRTFYRFSEGLEKQFQEMEKEDGPQNIPPYWNRISFRNSEVIFASPYIPAFFDGTVFLISFLLENGQLDMTNPEIYNLDDSSYLITKTLQGEKYVALGYNSPALITLGNTEVELIKIGPFLYEYSIYDSVLDKTPESTAIIVTCFYYIIAGSIDYTVLVGGNKNQDLPYLTNEELEDEGRLIGQAEIYKSKILVALQIHEKNSTGLPFFEIDRIQNIILRTFGQNRANNSVLSNGFNSKYK